MTRWHTLCHYRGFKVSLSWLQDIPANPGACVVIARYGSLSVPDVSAIETYTNSFTVGSVASTFRFETSVYFVSPLLLIPAVSTAWL